MAKNNIKLTVNYPDSSISKLCSVQTEQINELKKIRIEIEKGNSDRLLNIVDNDTVFTVGATLFVFFVGILVQWLYNLHKECIEEDKIRTYLLFNLSRIIDGYSTKLTNGYKQFYQHNDINSGFPITPPKVLSGMLNRISEINSDKLFNAYNEESKREAVSKVRDVIDSIRILEKHIESYHKDLLVKSGILRDELDTLSERYIEVLAHFSDELKQNPNHENDQTFIVLGSCVKLFYKDLVGKRSIKRYYREVIRPVQNELVRTGLYKSNNKALELASLGRTLSHKYNELKLLTVEARLEYRSYSGIMENATKSLKNNLMILKNP